MTEKAKKRLKGCSMIFCWPTVSPSTREASEVYQPSTYTPCCTIHEAASVGDIHQIEKLLAQGVSIHSRDDCGDMPLHIAACKGLLDVIELFLYIGAKVNARGRYLRCPLHCAAVEGQTPAAKMLLASGALLDAKDGEGATPLALAAQRGDADLVKLFIEHGASVLDCDECNSTILMHAVKRSTISTIERLLKNGATLDNANADGVTAVALAAEYNKLDLLKLMISSGVDINGADNDGRTPLTRAVRQQHMEVVKFLLQNGAVRGEKGVNESPLGIAAKKGNAELVEAIMSCKDAYNPDDVVDALQNVHTSDVVWMFADVAPDVVRDTGGELALLNAAENGHNDVMVALLDMGVDANVGKTFPKSKSDTPLHLAAAAGHVECVLTLLDRGATLMIQNSEGKTPLDCARDSGIETVFHDFRRY